MHSFKLLAISTHAMTKSYIISNNAVNIWSRLSHYQGLSQMISEAEDDRGIDALKTTIHSNFAWAHPCFANNIELVVEDGFRETITNASNIVSQIKKMLILSNVPNGKQQHLHYEIHMIQSMLNLHPEMIQ